MRITLQNLQRISCTPLLNQFMLQQKEEDLLVFPVFVKIVVKIFYKTVVQFVYVADRITQFGGNGRHCSVVYV